MTLLLVTAMGSIDLGALQPPMALEKGPPPYLGYVDSGFMEIALQPAVRRRVPPAACTAPGSFQPPMLPSGAPVLSSHCVTSRQHREQQ